MCQKHQLPCLHCHPQDYIRMVQHMIESCLVFQMSKEECVKALNKHANIEPIITLTVWDELLKENQAFFREYFRVSFSSEANGTLHSDD